MIPKHQREAISRHEERLNELLHAAVEELESISGYGLESPTGTKPTVRSPFYFKTYLC